MPPFLKYDFATCRPWLGSLMAPWPVSDRIPNVLSFSCLGAPKPALSARQPICHRHQPGHSAALIYRRYRTLKGATASLIVGSVVMTAITIADIMCFCLVERTGGASNAHGKPALFPLIYEGLVHFRVHFSALQAVSAIGADALIPLPTKSAIT